MDEPGMKIFISNLLNISLPLGIIGLNLMIQRHLAIGTPNIGRRITRFGIVCIGVATFFVISGLLAILCFKIPYYTWIAVSIAFYILAISLLAQGRRLTLEDTAQLNSLARKFNVFAWLCIVISVICIIAGSFLFSKIFQL